jgi:hypothetical protein
MLELPEVGDDVFCCLLTSAMCLPGGFIVHRCLSLFAVNRRFCCQFCCRGCCLSCSKGGYGIGCPWLFVAVLPVAPRGGSCSPVFVIVH